MFPMFPISTPTEGLIYSAEKIKLKISDKIVGTGKLYLYPK